MRLYLDSEMAARAAVLLDVLLVILFGAPERRGGRDFGDNRATEPAAGLEPRFQSSRCRLLGLVVIEDGRAVLSSDVRPLPVQCCRIVKSPRRSPAAAHSRSGTDQTEPERPRHGRSCPCRPPDSLGFPGGRPCSRPPSRSLPACCEMLPQLPRSSLPQTSPWPCLAPDRSGK